MTDPVDLDRLDALFANTFRSDMIGARIELDMALHHAWPAISAELRRLRAENEKLRAERDGAVRHALSTLDKQGDDDGN